jgi:hypothetical protein
MGEGHQGSGDQAAMRNERTADVARNIQRALRRMERVRCNALRLLHPACSTHHQRRSNPRQYGYNAGLLEGVTPYDIANVPTGDGVNH